MGFINSWVQSIIVAVIIVTIIEMILPNGNNKKYIKMVLGVFIMFNIISPLIDKITGRSIDFDSVIDIEKYISEASKYEVDVDGLTANNNSNIKEIYILNLKKDMKAKIEDKGYIVYSVQIQLEDDEEYTVKNVDLTIGKKESESQNSVVDSIKSVEKVNIQVGIDEKEKKEDEEEIKSVLSQKDISEIKEYINSTYEIDKNKIFINK